ncbi:peptidyl-prolyl cis-trans isomerase-like 3 isoform X1 [Macrobrachium rosenbergii]|uniref:peptidyl-prolyl cis-trans isomerase-like 3 isoform X1 n=1 Tax=Macrobrachium rosenbergii TaxID=79674 RepID=UPI0034D68A06
MEGNSLRTQQQLTKIGFSYVKTCFFSLQHNVRGTVSMANRGPNTNGSQFFISYSPQPHLDLKYTVFGKVIDGLEVLDELEKLPVNPKNHRPTTETRITSVTIHANPIAG